MARHDEGYSAGSNGEYMQSDCILKSVGDLAISVCRFDLDAPRSDGWFTKPGLSFCAGEGSDSRHAISQVFCGMGAGTDVQMLVPRPARSWRRSGRIQDQAAGPVERRRGGRCRGPIVEGCLCLVSPAGLAPSKNVSPCPIAPPRRMICIPGPLKQCPLPPESRRIPAVHALLLEGIDSSLVWERPPASPCITVNPAMAPASIKSGVRGGPDIPAVHGEALA